MLRYSRIGIIIALAIAVFTSCNRIPEQAKYIPKDAIIVSGINIKSLGKKIAWEVLTGSKLFKELEKQVPTDVPDSLKDKIKKSNDALSGLDKSGIDILNTIYIYVKTDKRYSSGNRSTILVPLNDAGAWGAWVKKAFPKAEIKEHNGRKETGFGSMYMGWDKNLLIVINTMSSPLEHMLYTTDNSMNNAPSAEETAELSAELDKAFNVPKENSLLKNMRFDSLEKVGHDITLWINYGEIMNQYGSDNVAQMTGGVAFSPDIWKDATLALGFDFEKGKITADMLYYLPEKLKSAGIQFGATNMDKDLVERLPSENLDLIFTNHCSTTGIKTMMDSTGLLNIANSSLNAAGITMDSILDAFTGDFAFTMNNFKVTKLRLNDNSYDDDHINKVSLELNLAIKINKKNNFNALYQMAMSVLQASNNNMIKIGDNGVAIPLNDPNNDTVFYFMNDQYAVLSNKMQNATGFLKGDFKNQKMDKTASDMILGCPWTLYFDVQSFCKDVDISALSSSRSDSMEIELSKKLLKTISFNGGAFKNNAFQYHMNIVFSNSEENSLITLLDFAKKMQDANKTEEAKVNF